jgi:ABC-2 type transport system ATP-binding protein
MRKGLFGGITTVVASAALLAWVPAASAKDVTITSFDGTKIAAHWFVGKGVGPGDHAPTILEGPGWSSGGDTNTEGSSNPIADANSVFGVPGISTFVKSGYNVLTWDPRGFGQSGGTVEIDDPKYEGRDVQALIDFVGKQPEAQLDPFCSTRKRRAKKGKARKRRAKRLTTCATSPDDPTIGMAGASYGGGIQLVSAGLDKRIDAIAPTIAWHSLISSLFPEGNVKLGWGSILVAAGVQGSLQGGFASPATAPGRQDPHFYSIVVNGTATGTTSQDDLDWMASHGPGDLLDKIKVPTLLLQGTADTLFPLDEAAANFDTVGDNPLRTAQIKRKKKRRKRAKRSAADIPRVPVKMVWFCGGHGVCLTDPGPGAAYLDQRTLAWFDRYLRGKQDIDTGPKFAWIADDGQLRTSDAYPLKPAGQLTATGSGPLPITPGQGSGGLIFASPAVNALNVSIPGPSSDANVVGAPHLDLDYQGSAVPQSTWVYAQFVNPRNGTVLGNQATPIPLTLDGQPHSISRDLELVAGRAPAGGGYTLQLTPSSSLFDMQRATGAVTFNGISVSLPLGDPVVGGGVQAKHKKKHKRHKKHKKHHR